jgi:hypothetical protein
MVKSFKRTLWIADDESYGFGDVIVVDTSSWSDEDYEHFGNADDSDKWETALLIASRKEAK